MITASATSTRHITLVAAGAAVGGFLFGFDTSTMNGAINGIRPTLRLGPGAEGFVVAIVLIGCALGAWFAGPLSTRVGRLRIMFLVGSLVALGSLTAAFSSELALLGLSRFVVGLGIGAASAVIPPFLAEIAPTRIRGRLGSFWQFAIVLGQFLGLLVGYALSRWAGSPAAPVPWGGTSWRWMFVVAALPAAAFVAITGRLPESPHTLIRHGREDEAKAWLARVSDEPVEDQVSAIRRALAGQRKTSLGDLRGSRFGLRPIVWTGILLAAFQQLVGINIVKTYSTTLWRSVGFSTGSSFRFSLLTVLISIASTVVAIALMDRVGRRTLLVAGAAVMVLASGTLAVCFSTTTGSGDDGGLGRAAGVAALVAVNVFAVGFGVTWGPVMWVMLSELFASDIRSTAVAVCTAVNWLTNWAVTRTFPLLADLGLGFAYGVYTAFAALALLFALKGLPETRGRSLA